MIYRLVAIEILLLGVLCFPKPYGDSGPAKKSEAGSQIRSSLPAASSISAGLNNGNHSFYIGVCNFGNYTSPRPTSKDRDYFQRFSSSPPRLPRRAGEENHASVHLTSALSAKRSVMEDTSKILRYNEQYIPFCNEQGQWGYLDAGTKKILIPPKYQYADLFEQGVAAVMQPNPAARSDEDQSLTGWIDMTGKEIFPPAFTGVYTVSSRMGDTLADLRKVVTPSGQTGILSLNGSWLIPLGKYQDFECYDRRHFLADKKYWLADDTVYPAPPGCEITRVDMDRQLFYLQAGDELHHGLSDWTGAPWVKPDYIDILYLDGLHSALASRLKAGNNLKALMKQVYAQKIDTPRIDDFYNDLIRADGTIYGSFTSAETPVLIDSVTASYSFKDFTYYIDLRSGRTLTTAPRVDSAADYEVFRQQTLFGLKDKEGQILLPAVYPKLVSIGPDVLIAGEPGQSYGEHTGVIDIHGHQIIPFRYGDLDYSNQRQALIAYKEGHYGMIDLHGRTLIDFKYRNYFDFEDGYASVYDGQHQGVIDTTGKTILPLIYQEIFNTKSLDHTSEIYYTASKDNEWTLLDAQGKTIIALSGHYGFLSLRTEEFASGWVRTEDSARSAYGLYNIRTGVILPPIYSSIRICDSSLIVKTAPPNTDPNPATSSQQTEALFQLLDFRGHPLTEPVYESMDYADGHLLCRRDGHYGVLDEKGSVIIPFRYHYLWRKTPHLWIAEQDKQYFYINNQGGEYRLTARNGIGQ